MKVFTSDKIRQIDAYTIDHEPIASIDLMERAASRLFEWIVKNYPNEKRFIVFAGPGNNGGDGVAIARMLAQEGFDVGLYVLSASEYSEDLKINIQRLNAQGIITPIFIDSNSSIPDILCDSIVIDALFGSGLTRPLSDIAASLVEHINSSKAEVIAIDIPSGLFGEQNPYPNPNAVVRAHFTLTLQFPKISFFLPENEEFIGNWHIIDIKLHQQIIEETETPYRFVDTEFVRSLILKRSKYSHKGTFGHALVVAGSYGMMGAAVLSTRACLRAGVGLVTTHIPKLGYTILQCSVPEAIADTDQNDFFLTGVEELNRFSAVALGPGIGQHPQTVNAIRDLISIIERPLIIDADGLNILASYPDLISTLPMGTILTPHIGEFNRLFGKQNTSYERMQVAIQMASKFEIVIIIKGAHSQVICPSGAVIFNSTGNPGMATAGSGDVLTGIIVSLLSQGYSPSDASVLGVYIHGLAGDLALKHISEQSLIASDILEHIGKAFAYLAH